MDEIQQRINKAIQVLNSELSLPQKATESLKAFSGLDITHATEKNKKILREFPGKINAIIGRYTFIKTYEDYARIPESDLNKILQNVQWLCLKLLANAKIG